MSVGDNFTETFQENVEEEQQGSRNQTDAEEEAAEGFQESLEEETSDSESTGSDQSSSSGSDDDGGVVDRAAETARSAADTVTSAGRAAADTAGDAVSNITGDEDDSAGEEASSTEEPDTVSSTDSEPAVEESAEQNAVGQAAETLGNVADTATRAARDVGQQATSAFGDALQTAEETTPANFDTEDDRSSQQARERAAAGVGSLRRTGTPSGEERDTGQREAFGDPDVTPDFIDRRLPGNPRTRENALEDAIGTVSRRGAEAGSAVGGAAGATADVATTAVRNPESLVDVRSGSIQQGDQGFQISAGETTSDFGERTGQSFGERVGRSASLPLDAVAFVDETAETAVAAGQEAPGLVEAQRNPFRVRRVGDGRNQQLLVEAQDPNLRTDPDDQTEEVTNNLTERASNAFVGLAAGGLEFNQQRVQERSGDGLNLPGFGDQAEADIETAAATITADNRTDEPLIQVQKGQEAEAFGSILGGAALAGGSVAAGTASTRAVQAASRRGARIARRRQADVVVQADDLVAQQQRQQVLGEGNQPTFETSTDAPASEAADELRRRAGENPDELADAVASNRVLLRSEEERLPRDVEAQRGNFELAGLFTSGDLPPLRADVSDTASSSTRTELRLPRLRDFSPNRDRDRFSAFPGDRVDEIPDRGDESGFAVEDGERVPDPEASGNQFLQNEAEEGTAFVRATGDRTEEFEGVFPPETEFSRQGSGIIEFDDGTQADLDIFRRPKDRVRRASGGLGAVGRRQDVDLEAPDQRRRRSSTGESADSVTARDLSDRRRSRRSSSDVTRRSDPAGVLPADGSSGTSSRRSDPGQPSVPAAGGASSAGDSPSAPSPTIPGFGSFTSPGGPDSPPSDGGVSLGGGGSSGGGGPGGGGPTFGGGGGGGGGGPGGGGGGGGGGVPFIPGTPNRPPRARSDTESDADEGDELVGLVGSRQDQLTDFIDPLTGERLETEPGANVPRFGGNNLVSE